MYTRCPSCRAEISFEPPRNLANLPQGYKHRIRCPNCGVTISVKIPNTAVVASPAPTYSYENPNQQGYSDIQVGVGTPQTGAEQEAVQESAKKANKKSYGRAKAAVLFVFSLLIIAAAVLSFVQDKIPAIAPYIGMFNPIQTLKEVITNFSGFIQPYKDAVVGGESILSAVLALIFNHAAYVVIFAFAGFTFITNLLVLIIGKYNGAAKAFNIIFAIFVLAFAIAHFVIGLIGNAYGEGLSFLDYLKAIIANKDYIVYVILGIALVDFILGFVFIAKTKNEKRIKGIVDEE